jgi:protease-4
MASIANIQIALDEVPRTTQGDSDQMTVWQKLLWMIIGGGLVLALACVGCVGTFMLATSLGGSELSLGPAVSIVRVEGTIVSGNPSITPLGVAEGAYSGTIVRHLKAAEEDPTVKAVVLRVDSPGGSVVASDEIYQQVVSMTKPIVVSMGELAASGGYYVSAPADEIFANPNTLTGSIGVISQFINFGELLKEYGVEVTTIKTGDFKDEGSPFRSMSEEEISVWQSIVDDAYEEFVQIVADGRGMSTERVKELADGRVYTGEQALDLGLVDQLGNLPAAIQRAAELGGIEGEPRIIENEQPFNFFEGLFSSLARPADPLAEVMSLLGRDGRPALQYLYVGP